MRTGLIIGVIVITILCVGGIYSYITVANGSIDPLGRLAFVKIENPDMYPGHPHAVLLAQYAQERNSSCALVVHFAGSSNYRSFPETVNTTSGQNGSVYIIEVAYIDTQGKGSASLSQINLLDSLKVAIYGVPDTRYKYMSDGVIYNNYTSMMAHVQTLEKEHGQVGPLPMVWHGTTRVDSPYIDPGCGFPLYFQIMTKTYGLIPAYYYMIAGLIFPYFNDPYAHFELSHASELQTLYNEGALNYNFVNVSNGVDQYYKNLNSSQSSESSGSASVNELKNYD